MNAIANLSNWHRYLIAFLIGLDAVCVAIASGAVAVPEGLKEVTPWAALLNIFIVAMLPRFQLPTGEGAPPVLSPKPPELPNAAVPLVPAFKLPAGSQPVPYNPAAAPPLVDGHELPFTKPPAAPLP